jgi:CheY-like chemotaxis protein
MIKKILLVDDDKALRETFKKGLETYSDSLHVVTAEDGESAMEKLKSQDIFLLITDLKMPKVDGFALLSHVMEHYPEVPVIVITGYGTPQMKQMAQRGGAVGYIEKPFMIQDLAQAALTQLRKISEGGMLHHVSSGMFLQLIEMEEKTCTIRVEDKRTGRFGVLYFLNGKLLDAKVEERKAEAAAYEIFAWDDVSISIQNSCLVTEGPIQGDIQSILMEAMRLKDEHSLSAGAEEENDGEAGRDAQPDTGREVVDETGSEAPDPEEIEEIDPEDVSGAIEDDISTVDYIRIKLRAELGDKSGLNDVYVDTAWDTLIKRFQALGSLFGTGSLRMCYLDRGDMGDLVLLPGPENITISLKAKFPRDKIINLLGR